MIKQEIDEKVKLHKMKEELGKQVADEARVKEESVKNKKKEGGKEMKEKQN